MKLLRYFSINLKNSARMHKLYLDIKFNKDILQLIFIFYNRGYLNSFLFLTKKVIRIFLVYYKYKSIFNSLICHFKFFNRKDLYSCLNAKKHLSSSIFFFKTVKGFVDLDYCFLHHIYMKNVLICQLKY